MIRYIGYYNAQFVDRLGDTFRWKGENVSTSEVENIIASFEQIDHSSVFGVEISGTEGRAGMACVKASVSPENLKLGELLNFMQKNLPPYAIPKFIRILSELKTTSTFKIKKSEMKKVDFNITKTDDPIYVLLPQSSEYTLITEEIYKNIINGKYRF